MVDIVTRLGKGSPLTNAEVDANFTNLAEVSGVTGEPMGHEDRTTSTISFNASTRTFTIAPVASSFTVWCKGKKFVISSAQTVTIPNTTGMYSIYFDANGALAAKAGYFTFSLEVPTAYIYWNATAGTCPYFGDERHGVVLDWQTHEYLHRTRGAALASGFAASGYVLGGNGSLNSHAQLTLEGGTFFDEDMKIVVVATDTPTAGTWEQDLLSPARIPVLYLSGTAWVIDAPTDYPLKQGTARPQYNAYSGGVWSTADVANNKYATSWILATNNLTYPVIAIIGQAQSDLQSAAEAVDFTSLQLPGFPSVEFRPLYKLVFQCADSCSNAVHASLASITDIRSIAAAGTAASIVTDHGNLTGLSDDDHPQYIHVDTLRTVSAAVKASFLPSQTSNAGKFLQTDGTATSWQALTSSNVTTALGFTPYNATNPSGYISGITSGMVTTALGFTPYNATNPSGYVTAAGARGAISVTGAGSYDSATGVINIVGGVTSFNTRTGAITLSSADVTTALGFTPYNNTNPSGYITGITSTMVTTALGFTPYNSSNPNGYISSITSANVTTALGFTPYNSSNPSGYITSSALSGYLTSASAASTYLPLSGGTLTGTTTLSGGRFYVSSAASGQAYGGTIHIRDTEATGANNSFAGIAFSSSPGADYVIGKYSNSGTGYLQIRNHLGTGIWLLASDGTVTQNGNLVINGSNQVLHAGNYNSYAPTLTGTGASGTWGISITGTAKGVVTTDPGIGTGGLWVTSASGLNIARNGTAYIGLDAGNYNSYAPTLTGTGASGTWGINVNGTAGSVIIDNSITWGRSGLQFVQVSGIGGTNPALTQAPDGNWWHIIRANHANSAGYYTDLALPFTSDGGVQYRRISNGVNNGWYLLLDSHNYNSYALPLSGGTLSGPIIVNAGSGYPIQSTSNQRYQVWIKNTSATAQTAGWWFAHDSGGNLVFHADSSGDKASIAASGYGFQVGVASTYDNPGGWGANLVASGQYHARVRVKGTSYNSSGDNEAYLWVDNTVSPRSGLYSSTAFNMNVAGGLYESGSRVLNSSNYSSYALPLSGGTLTGQITLASGTPWQVLAPGSGTFNKHVQYITSSEYTLEAALATDISSGAKLPITFTWRGGYGSTGGLQLTGGASGTLGGNTILHAGNYTNYANAKGGGWYGSGLPGTRWGGYSTNGGEISFGDGLPNAYQMGILIDGCYVAGENNGFWSLGGDNTWGSRRGMYWDGSYLNFTTNSATAYFSNALIGGNQIFHAGNYTGYSGIVRALGYPSSSNDWNSLGNSYGNSILQVDPSNFASTSNGPTAASYTYGTLLNFASNQNSQSQIYISHAGNDLIFRGGWGGASWQAWNRVLTNQNYTSYALPLSGGTVTGQVTFRDSGDTQITLNGNGTTWSGITATDVNGTDYMWVYGATGTWAFGGGGSTVSGKKMHIHGGVTIGSSYAQTSNPTNGLNVEGAIQQAGNQVLHAGNYTSYSPSLGGSGASGTWGISVSGNSAGTTNVNNTGFGSGSFTWYQTSVGLQQYTGGWASFMINNHGDGSSYYNQTIIMPFWDAPMYMRKEGGTNRGPYTFLTTENYNSINYPTANNAIRASGNFYIDTNYGRGIVGVYSSYRYQGVFAMGDSYKLADDGTTTGSLYGMAWSHPNAGGAAGNLDSHGLLVLINGGYGSSMSYSIKASSNVTAYSDERLKTNWRPMPENFVARLAQVRVGIYDRIDGEKITQVGVGAQSFQKLLPQAIETAKDEMGTLSVAYGNAALASAIELAKEVVDLRTRVAQLESLIHKLIGD